MKLYILDPIHIDAVSFLRESVPQIDVILWSDQDAAHWVDDADGIIVRASKVTGEKILSAKNLKVIGKHGVGYDKIDTAVMKEKGIALINTPYENSNSVAELAVAQMLACTRNILLGSQIVKTGRWKDKGKLVSVELYGKAAGFVGYGHIARKVAKILQDAFHTVSFAYDPLIQAERWKDFVPAVTPCNSLNELFSKCDILSIHVPKTPATMNMISDGQLNAVKPGAILVNTARGGVVDETALYNALKEGKLMAAASDVFAKEPPNRENPLFSLPNFIPTPHVGGSTVESTRRVAMAVAGETAAFLLGKGNPLYRVQL